MFKGSIFKDIGVTNLTEFTDNSYRQMLKDYPRAFELRKELNKYNDIKRRRDKKQQQLDNVIQNNNDLPNHSTRINELNRLLTSLDNILQDISSLTDKEYIDYTMQRDKFRQEKQNLEQEQQPKDTTQLENDLSNLETELSNQKTIVNEISNDMNMGDKV